jgi:transketolase
MTDSPSALVARRYDELSSHFAYWEKTKDLIDQLIDLMLNYRQSGHPGGSRSKVHALLVTLLSGEMRWDIATPRNASATALYWAPGIQSPLIYATLAVFNEAMRTKFEQTGDKRYQIPGPAERTLYWPDLMNFRRRGGLSGHAEMEGKTLFLKFNTGPSGHGSPAAAGEALALKRAGAQGVRCLSLRARAV